LSEARLLIARIVFIHRRVRAILGAVIRIFHVFLALALLAPAAMSAAQGRGTPSRSPDSAATAQAPGQPTTQDRLTRLEQDLMRAECKPAARQAAAQAQTGIGPRGCWTQPAPRPPEP
jgi:hypothetical protein